MRYLALLISLLVVWGCGAPPDDDDDSGVVDDDDDAADGDATFSWVHTNVILESCSCHQDGQHSSGLAGLDDAGTAYTALVGAESGGSPGMNLVEPGDSDASYLMHKLDGTHDSVGGAGSQMPLSGCCLEDDVRDTIRDWIDAGAEDN